MTCHEKPSEEKVESNKVNVLERLFARDEKMVYKVLSDNESTTIFDVPEILRPFKEKHIMWDMVRNPTSDNEQIADRQEILENFVNSDSLQELTQLKECSYSINQGVKKIFGIVEIRKKRDGDDDYRDRTESMKAIEAYWRGYYSKEVILGYIGEIKKGQEGLEKIIEKFGEIDKPIFHEMKELLENDLNIIKNFDEEYFLNINREVNEGKTLNLNNGVNNHLMQIGSMVEFANVVVKESLSKAGYDDNKLAIYSRGRNIVRDNDNKEPEVLNNSVDDLPISILCGANSGGKSYKLETDLFIQLFAQSIGFVPVEKGNFRIYDSIVYLDRTSTDSDNNLSAHGVEVIRWKEVLKKIGNKVLMFVDEGFSGTSAEDQYCILAGVAEYIKKHQGKIILSSHNEAFVDNYANDSQVDIYNFPFILGKDEDGKLKIDQPHKMEKGKGDPRAIEVAESMGMDMEIIDFAKKYIDGILVEVEPLTKKEWKKIEKYSEAERSKLKKESECNIFVDTPNIENKSCYLFTKDKDFLIDHNGDYKIITGEKIDNVKLGKEVDDFSKRRKNYLFKFLTRSEISNGKEIVERQKMFEELSTNDRYKELREMGNKLCKNIDIMSNYPKLAEDRGLLDFNSALRLNKNDKKCDELSDYEFGIMFLNLNKKALGKEFPISLEKILEKFEKAKELYLAYCGSMDIFEIEKGIQADLDELITEKSIVERYKELTSDDPNAKIWGDKLTRRRIVEYLSWLRGQDRARWCNATYEDEKTDPLAKLIKKIMNGYDTISLEYTNDFKAIGIINVFSYADDEPLEAQNKWGDKITLGRLLEYRDFLRNQEVHGEDANIDFDKKISRVEGLIYKIEKNLSKLNIKDERLRKMYSELFGLEVDDTYRMFGESITKYLENLMRPFYDDDIYDSLPIKSFFECDIQSMAPEIKYFANYFRRLANSSWHGGSFELILSSFLEMFVDKNYFEEFPKLLRSYDSVYLHQMANKFEKMFSEYLPILKIEDEFLDIDDAQDYFDDNEDRFKILCDEETFKKIVLELEAGVYNELISVVNKFTLSGPQKFFNIFEAIYENKIKDIYDDYGELDRLFKSIFEKHGIEDDSYLVENIRTIYDNPTINSHDLLIDILRIFQDITGTTVEKVNIGYHKEWVDRETLELEKENYVKFYQEKVIDSGWKEKMGKFLKDLDEASERAKIFIDKHKITFWINGENGLDEVQARIRKGNIANLKSEIIDRYDRGLSIIKGKDYDIDHYEVIEQKKSMIEWVLEAETLGLVGHMINSEKFCKNSINENGSINIKGLFSVFKPKDEQVLNDVSFGDNELTKIIEAPNMSGKTFLEKALTMAILWGINTGFLPAKEASIPLIEKVIFFDRISHRFDKNYGAMGNEVSLWKSLLRIIKKDKAVFAIANVDEAFSTTSPKYQASFVYAIVMEMIKQGQYLAIASHNHDVINKLRKLEKEFIKAYTLKVEIDKDNKVKFDYNLREMDAGEWCDSMGVEVAKTLGMNVEIIETAERIKAGLIKARNGRVNLA